MDTQEFFTELETIDTHTAPDLVLMIIVNLLSKIAEHILKYDPITGLSLKVICLRWKIMQNPTASNEDVATYARYKKKLFAFERVRKNL